VLLPETGGGPHTPITSAVVCNLHAGTNETELIGVATVPAEGRSALRGIAALFGGWVGKTGSSGVLSEGGGNLHTTALVA